jgi:hypothetical protein
MTEDSLFNARKTLLSEASGAPDARWWTVSLVTAVHGLVTWTPTEPLDWPHQVSSPDARLEANPDARLEAFLAAAEELTRRGLDAESLVRYGMPNEIAGVLMGMLLMDELGLGEPDLARRRGVDLDAWREALGPVAELGSGSKEFSSQRLHEIAAGYARTYVPAIFSWIAAAPLTSLVMLTPPEGTQLVQTVPCIGGNKKLREQYAWLVDRFSTNSVRSWLTTSLQYEFRWQDEAEPPPCPEELMIERELEEHELNAELAMRSAHSLGGDPDPQSVLASEVDSHARNLCAQGRHQEAATLFEFAVLRRPYDSEVRNNLGFCLIPENPAVAIKELQAAAHMGYAHPAINAYNRACCYLALEQPRAAMATVEEYWPVKVPDPDGAMLWQWAPGADWVLANVEDPNAALADLMINVAGKMGWAEDQRRWEERARILEP